MTKSDFRIKHFSLNSALKEGNYKLTDYSGYSACGKDRYCEVTCSLLSCYQAGGNYSTFETVIRLPLTDVEKIVHSIKDPLNTQGYLVNIEGDINRNTLKLLYSKDDSFITKQFRNHTDILPEATKMIKKQVLALFK